MANGAAGNSTVEIDTHEFKIFRKYLLAVMKKLAADIVLDAEGATKFVTVKVKNAASASDAEKVAEAIANSLLCKTAWFGCDPNWGRVIAAAGYSGADFDPEKLSLFYEDKPVVEKGRDAGTPEKELSDLMSKGDFSVILDLNAGSSDYEIWTCDISYEYVKINADYHT
jgi:glutamate N-acetyltransferase/amino-acid N-acetyltransferase